MNPKHVDIRIAQCVALAERASNCPRLKVGAMLVDPGRNTVLMDGYNGGPRGGSPLCGEHDPSGDPVCLREHLGIKHGERYEIGCHHAEMNVICNAAARGIATDGAWLFITCGPCLLCAKLIHHSGIRAVVVINAGGRGFEGEDYLVQHGVYVERRETPPPVPIRMILFCPKCEVKHVDGPDDRTPDWTNPPHRTHLCHECGHKWRPALVPTEGVESL